MTEDERELITRLVAVPCTKFAGQCISKQEFLERFRDGKILTNELLAEAIESKIADDLECALIVGFSFGFTKESMGLLLQLLQEGWHFKHEDVVSALADLKAPEAVEALYKVTHWVPSYLEFDDARALAVKAIWALGAIADPRAQAFLMALSTDQNIIIQQNALKQLSMRAGRFT
ncbi:MULTISPECIES: HEAT repeat domain-containing protein [unclassified Rhizobium]|uniref:HEAT repeat domain-containing protein n=1 Tax=unclassified Rhizobium TaxID=2613769 RepID=UPI0007E9DAA6|nr:MULTISPECIES: HEAT repeat domain-containing protein [unclassified Rhizobium]ANM14042.1 hypothetical protein AMK05_PD00141 [Rhizobium sp. N324]ANM20422.1 hypothetical protein AMK06_PD00143 [Rhizobium sp. N541]ANM26806.1 hypothetical protein AMK07_PD00143 [Rhizobium sp. N941]OYD00211.1 hypothetical protein AMK08_PD00141 [Rhizobium sp. N4311]